MKLSYIDMINCFNEWCYDHQVDMKVQIIYYKLLHLINRNQWKEWTEISNFRLMGLCGFSSEMTFIRCRDKLIELGFLDYQKGKKGQPNRYKLVLDNFKNSRYTIKYTVKNDSKNDSEIDSISDSKNDSTSVSHNKTKTKDKDNKESTHKCVQKKNSILGISESNENCKVAKEVKKAYGSAKNVMLTAKQYTSLQAKYGDELPEMIEYLSDYIAVHGKKYKDHSRVLNNWVRDAVRKQRIDRKELEAREKRIGQGYSYTQNYLNSKVNSSTNIRDWI